jgi:hypothetical protein
MPELVRVTYLPAFGPNTNLLAIDEAVVSVIAERKLENEHRIGCSKLSARRISWLHILQTLS